MSAVHLRIILAALLGAIRVVSVSIAAHLGADEISRLQSDLPIKIPSTAVVDRAIHR
jgi:hypothetical protein